MISDKLHFYDDGVETMVMGDGDLSGPTQTPSTKLHIVDDGDTQMGPVPKVPIHIIVGIDEFTDEDIRQWAEGNTQDIDEQPTVLIMYLSQIIVRLILDK